jgi:hypothetical protein
VWDATSGRVGQIQRLRDAGLGWTVDPIAAGDEVDVDTLERLHERDVRPP